MAQLAQNSGCTNTVARVEYISTVGLEILNLLTSVHSTCVCFEILTKVFE